MSCEIAIISESKAPFALTISKPLPLSIKKHSGLTEVIVKAPPANLSPISLESLNSPYSPPPLKTPTVTFEMGIAVLQAYIYTILTSIYLGEAVNSH